METVARKSSMFEGEGQKVPRTAKRRSTTANVFSVQKSSEAGRRDSDAHSSHSAVKRLERELKALREEYEQLKWSVGGPEGKTQNVLFQEEKKMREMQLDIKVKDELLITMKLNL